MNIAIYGPGRAGGALALAAVEAGHTIVSVKGRNPDRALALADRVGIADGEADILIIAVSDDALASIHEMVVPTAVPYVVHVSGAVPVSILHEFRDAGSIIGSFHPLQTMPDAESGATRLTGASIAVTADEPLRGALFELAESLGCQPFDVADEVKPLYHAAAAAAANATIASLVVASDLYQSAGVEFSHTRPLVDAVVANAFELGPADALTGPIARGDVATVEAHVNAVRTAAPESLDAFLSLCKAVAEVAGRAGEFEGVLR